MPIPLNEQFKFLRDYDEDAANVESFSYCPGAGRHIDISQFSEEEIVRSDNFDTYCVKYFCGMADPCTACENFKHRQR